MSAEEHLDGFLLLLLRMRSVLFLLRVSHDTCPSPTFQNKELDCPQKPKHLRVSEGCRTQLRCLGLVCTGCAYWHSL